MTFFSKSVSVFVYFLFLFTNVFTLSASNGKTPLQQKVSENGRLFKENINSAFLQIDILLKEAVLERDSLSELKLLERRCLYFYNKEDVNGLVIACEAFQKKASEYNNANSVAMSYVYLAETLSMNGLHDRAIAELDKALAALEKSNTKDVKSIYTKANVLISQGNIYNDKGNPKKAAERLLKAINNYDRLSDPEEIKQVNYLNYANLASIYAEIDIDSAAYYVQKSISLKPESYPDTDGMMGLNNLVLGKVYLHKHDYNSALRYFLGAENISDKRGEMLNAADLYKCIIETYIALGEKTKAESYRQKLKEHELNTLKSKYDSLHKVLKVPEAKKSFLTKYAGWGVAIVALLVLSVYLVLFYLKGKKPGKEQILPDVEEKYESLIDLIKKDDPAYFFLFEELYPDFKPKILSIEPNISRAEMEFCTLLKLNLSTKKIAQLKFLEVRTVQNKKYKIRKKLNIPQEEDIYNWFAAV
ncbi:hypothetical protein GR160_17375 [Flavobacterium sp. Sd200]|uniref:tetratricopeptide repeat protein n=1 Tax=Flavobacterium sp. Sd200 TaxID=2692211 RepID=UPI00136913BA|nr:hypothetical protein [Flavobacterium sp. Sd200]MXN93000.1 hypothetical protein [Flavobacterium sp. Sd200]